MLNLPTTGHPKIPVLTGLHTKKKKCLQRLVCWKLSLGCKLCSERESEEAIGSCLCGWMGSQKASNSEQTLLRWQNYGKGALVGGGRSLSVYL